MAPATIPPNAFLEPWFWNIFLSYWAWAQMIACNGIGFWGEVLYNDNGEMMDRCYRGFPGDDVNYEMVLTDTVSSI